MRKLQTSGTLGDCYIIALKLFSCREPVELHHFVRGGHEYWREKMEYILRLAPAVQRVRFTDAPVQELPAVTTDPKGRDPILEDMQIAMTWFVPEAAPGHPALLPASPSRLRWSRREYWVLLVNAGKPMGRGRNTKWLDPEWVAQLVAQEHLRPVVLVGDAPDYRDIPIARGLNLVTRQRLPEAMCTVANAEHFYGPAGLLLFVALSHGVPSTACATCRETMQKCMLGTPWEKFCTVRYFPPELRSL